MSPPGDAGPTLDPPPGRLSGEPLGVYRTLPARVIGWAMVALAAGLAALTGYDVLLGRTQGLVTGLALVMGLTGVSWALFLRPHVRLHDDGLVIANVVTDTVVPFGAVEEITTRWALEVHDIRGHRHSSWAVPVKRERTVRRRVDDFAETTRARGNAGVTAQGVADQVHRALQRWRLDGGQLAGAGGAGEERVTRRGAWSAVLVLVVAGVLAAVAVLG